MPTFSALDLFARRDTHAVAGLTRCVRVVLTLFLAGVAVAARSPGLAANLDDSPTQSDPLNTGTGSPGVAAPAELDDRVLGVTTIDGGYFVAYASPPRVVAEPDGTQRGHIDLPPSFRLDVGFLLGVVACDSERIMTSAIPIVISKIGGVTAYDRTRGGWTPRPGSIGRTLAACDAAGGHLVAVSDGIHLFSSSDCGGTWSQADIFAESRLVDVAIDGTGAALAFDHRGGVYRRADSESAWETGSHVSLPADSSLIGGDALGPLCIAIDDRGVLYASHDHAESWERQPIHIQGCKESFVVDAALLSSGVAVALLRSGRLALSPGFDRIEPGLPAPSFVHEWKPIGPAAGFAELGADRIELMPKDRLFVYGHRWAVVDLPTGSHGAADAFEE